MTKKIGISLPDDLYAWLQASVEEGRADSVSGMIADTLAARRQREGLAELVADLKAEFGEPTPEEVAWADDVLRRAQALAEGRDPGSRSEAS
ncbi:hypothetical protein [Thermoactinospora rubra]|uniref:hypothetical protein n=1 Tax=Thermoactinospora rubra TaxID=1088767 RepID=UPI000A111F06|nr:hypothetical protein [Thermoactinospora rubra]